MKNKVLKALLIIETLIIMLEVLCVCFSFVNRKKTELFHEDSSNGDYVLSISEIGNKSIDSSDGLRITDGILCFTI